MTLDPMLIEILVDPEDKETLWYLEDEALLYNPRLKRGYAIRDGIPVMLIDEAVAIDDENVARIAKLESSVVKTGTLRS